MPRFLRHVLLAGWLAAGCTPGVPEDACVWGEVRPCTCESGEEGSQLCPFAGRWGPCSCGGSLDGGSGECGGAFISCGGRCVDPTNDARHCGGCDRSCGDGECVDGACRGHGCGSEELLCPGVGCVAARRDPDHCGACGNACADDEACVSSVCTSLDEICARRVDFYQMELFGCDHTCVSRFNVQHCGGVCGNACAPGERCDGERCVDDSHGVVIFPDPVIGGLVTGPGWHDCGGSGDFASVEDVACRQLGFVGRRGSAAGIPGKSLEQLLAEHDLGERRSYSCEGDEESLGLCRWDPVEEPCVEGFITNCHDYRGL
jgi:hypothetical protein